MPFPFEKMEKLSFVLELNYRRKKKQHTFSSFLLIITNVVLFLILNC